MTYLVNSIGHVEIDVTDMDAVTREATGILGLHVTRRDAGQIWLASNGRTTELVLRSAKANAVRCVGFEAVSVQAVEEAAARVPQAGCRVLSEKPSLDCCAAGVVFATPQGHTFEVHAPIPDSIYDRRHFGAGLNPVRMDHVNITSPEPAETQRQVEQIMGLKLSEKLVDDGLIWMRGANRQHHIMGIVRGQPGLHHYSFELENFGEYCRLGDLLDQYGKELAWGPGRHRPGDNVYAYYVDAAGVMVECSSGMALIADDDNYQPNIITQLKRPENVRALNVWGTPAPQPWLAHHFPYAPAPQA
ncbi:VOC family protein [Bradyrhizobium sp.]|uniref:VOC family protein n=1 Tax=Bradyrhizobium sp. TaxID=376 RepID=UPI002732F7CC|nr:VOC family protein [Bradyrhizobium sp.]MDP3693558.1 VOC family protein [Bradyrhizobium sp.]